MGNKASVTSPVGGDVSGLPVVMQQPQSQPTPPFPLPSSTEVQNGGLQTGSVDITATELVDVAGVGETAPGYRRKNMMDVNGCCFFYGCDCEPCDGCDSCGECCHDCMCAPFLCCFDLCCGVPSAGGDTISGGCCDCCAGCDCGGMDCGGVDCGGMDCSGCSP